MSPHATPPRGTLHTDAHMDITPQPPQPPQRARASPRPVPWPSLKTEKKILVMCCAVGTVLPVGRLWGVYCIWVVYGTGTLGYTLRVLCVWVVYSLVQ